MQGDTTSCTGSNTLKELKSKTDAGFLQTSWCPDNDSALKNTYLLQSSSGVRQSQETQRKGRSVAVFRDDTGRINQAGGQLHNVWHIDKIMTEMEGEWGKEARRREEEERKKACTFQPYWFVRWTCSLSALRPSRASVFTAEGTWNTVDGASGSLTCSLMCEKLHGLQSKENLVKLAGQSLLCLWDFTPQRHNSSSVWREWELHNKASVRL